jgi:hypothetical protein
MSKRVLSARFVAGLSLAVMLGLALNANTAKAAAPAEGSAPAVASRATAALDAAAKNNKYLFIFFWRDDTQQSRAMRSVFQTTLAKMTDAADSIEIQTDDATEKQLVARYGVSRSPMPLVLAIAPNGAVTKGLPTRFDESQLRQGLVSPGTAECMKALQDRKLVLLCVEPASAQGKQAAVQQGVAEFTADKQYAENSKVMFLSAGDPAEGAFLKDLRVDPKTAARVTVLISPPAAVIGSLTGDVTKAQLVDKLKSAQSGCCPGGKCGPNGCCPAK